MEELLKDTSQESQPNGNPRRAPSKSTSHIDEEKQSKDITNLRKINSQTILSSESNFCMGVLAGDLEVGSVFKLKSKDSNKPLRGSKSEPNARPLSDIERYTLCNRIV